MNIIEGNYFNGLYPVAVEATLTVLDREVALSAASISERHEKNQLEVSPRMGSTKRFIMLPNGGQFECADNILLDSLPQESKSEGIVAWLEKRLLVALACVAVIASVVIVGYVFGLPAAAKRIASRIPMETERSLGVQALTYLDKKEWIEPTGLEFDAREDIRKKFYRLSTDLRFKDYYQLEFRRSVFFGPNAIALPGGIIVITDQMVETAKEMEEVMAVLAHEIGHVELRHTMRSVLQNSAIGVIAATVTSDAATLNAAITDLPMVLAQTKYSRNFETAADDYAFKLLKQKGYSPEAFASLMERIAKESDGRTRRFAWISTHPVTSERVARARDAAAE